MIEFAILGRPRGPPYFLWSLNMNQKITAFLFGLLGTTLLICSCILALYFSAQSSSAGSLCFFTLIPVNSPGEGSLLSEREKLYQQNPDIVGWIQIEGTSIDYPVMQTPADPNYYLKHDFEKHYTDYGCPFYAGQIAMCFAHPIT